MYRFVIKIKISLLHYIFNEVFNIWNAFVSKNHYIKLIISEKYRVVVQKNFLSCLLLIKNIFLLEKVNSTYIL